jgi:hypothetical protein
MFICVLKIFFKFISFEIILIYYIYIKIIFKNKKYYFNIFNRYYTFKYPSGLASSLVAKMTESTFPSCEIIFCPLNSHNIFALFFLLLFLSCADLVYFKARHLQLLDQYLNDYQVNFPSTEWIYWPPKWSWIVQTIFFPRRIAHSSSFYMVQLRDHVETCDACGKLTHAKPLPAIWKWDSLSSGLIERQTPLKTSNLLTIVYC